MKEFKHEIQEIDNSLNPVPRTELRSVWGMFETFVVSPMAKPTDKPKNFENQVRILTDSLTTPTVIRLYIYSTKFNDWYYVTLT